ncbi:MAG: CapA family protein [Oscillospiraceae bacterium]|nr:CapA family protein [Oscillospiraceae bacterium]
MNRSRSGRRKTTGSQILFRYVLVLLVIATLAAGWLFYRTYFGSDKAAAPKAKPAPSQNLDATEHMPQTEPETEVPAPETTAAETEPQVMTVTMMAVGDNLIHNTVYRSGWGTDPWNYDHLYAHVKDDIESADIAVINQETIFVSTMRTSPTTPPSARPARSATRSTRQAST